MKTLIVIAVVFVTSCSSRPPETPEEVYRAFHQAIVTGDSELAMSYLSPQTLEKFRQAGKRLAWLDGVKADPLQFFLREVASAQHYHLRAVEVASRQEAQASLKVTGCDNEGNCHDSQLNMLRHQGRWVLNPQVPPLLIRPAGTTGGEGG